MTERRLSHGRWFVLGYYYGYLRWSLSQDISLLKAHQIGLQIAVEAAVVQQLTETIETSMEESKERMRRTRNGPPPISAAKESQLAMPTTPPTHRDTAPWPPFEGVRVELGGDEC